MTVRAPIVERTAEAAVTLVLKAPLSSFLMPIERVPDPVFAQKMVGDGIAVDPTSQSLLAPCEGEVVMLQRSGAAQRLDHIVAVEPRQRDSTLAY